METWFWILGWVLSFLTIIGNGFTIFLVCSRRNLRTKPNAFIVSLAVADFFVGLSAIPSLSFCDITNTCHWPHTHDHHLLSWVNFIRLLFSNTSVANLCVLVLDRLIAIVHPLKYITLMTRRRLIQVIFFAWVLPASYNVPRFILFMFYFKTIPVPFIWLTIILEFIPCVVLILCFVTMIFHVCFNHQVSFKLHHERSAVIMMGLVIGVFLVCYSLCLFQKRHKERV